MLINLEIFMQCPHSLSTSSIKATARLQNKNRMLYVVLFSHLYQQMYIYQQFPLLFLLLVEGWQCLCCLFPLEKIILNVND